MANSRDPATRSVWSRLAGSRATGLRQAGFTLMETLTVVFIIGIATTGIILMAPPDEGPLELEAGQLELTLQSLADRAVLTGSVQGLLVSPDGYQGMQYQSGGWVRLVRFRREFPKGIRLQSFEDQEGNIPQYRFDPIGLPAEGALGLSNGVDVIEVVLGREPVR